MTDRPIIFSAPMVRALLAGRKTQTRRLATSPLRRCESGDRLYVREAHRLTDCPCTEACRGPGNVYYEADGDGYQAVFRNRLRPSMHMPRWASRLTLIVAEVRVEPLQAISEADAEAEGCVCESADPPFWYVPGIMPHSLTGVGIEEPGGRQAERCYGKLWSLLHTKPGERWEDNPMVVALTFRVEQRNIDRKEAA